MKINIFKKLSTNKFNKTEIKSENGRKFLKIIQTKRNKFNIIPLSDKALEYIDDFTKLPCLNSIKCDIEAISKHFGKKFTFHTARHSFASNALINGANIVTISKCLGHSDLKTTMIYADMNRGAIYDEINNVFK